jgi:SMODS and SLOG-associating 2TM effector domain 1
MLEAIKLVGAIVGLVTGIFTAWDRWARGRPLAWVTAKKLGVNAYKYIHANKKIAVSLRWTEFSLALAATIITAMVGVAGKELLGIKFDFVALTAVLTTIAGAILAHIEATRCDFLVMIYRATARRLSAEIANIGNINTLSAEQWSDFVNRCESIISDENTSWAAK